MKSPIPDDTTAGMYMGGSGHVVHMAAYANMMASTECMPVHSASVGIPSTN
jgi:hypothetical protein